MTKSYLTAAFLVPVTPTEAELLTECFAVAAEIATDFARLLFSGPEAASAYYAERSDTFRAIFPTQPDEADPFAAFLQFWDAPEFAGFGAELSVRDDIKEVGLAAFIRGDQVDVQALASLIQKVCLSALPFAFQWANTTSSLEPSEFGGGYFVVTATEIVGGSTHWLMQHELQARKPPDAVAGLPAVKPVCPKCGSDQIVRDACARWDVQAYRWVLTDVHECDFCDACNAEGHELARWVAAGDLPTLTLPPAVGARVRIRERTRMGGDRFKGREGFIIRSHSFAGFYVRVDMTARERTQKTELVETDHLDVLWLAEPPDRAVGQPSPKLPPVHATETRDV